MDDVILVSQAPLSRDEINVNQHSVAVPVEQYDCAQFFVLLAAIFLYDYV